MSNSERSWDWTQDQKTIFSACTENLQQSYLLQACAGAAKTTTLEEIVRQLVAEAGVPPRDIAALAFNKKIADTLATRLPHGVTCSTLNSLGHRALSRFLPFGRLSVSAWKESNLWRDNHSLFRSLDKSEQKNIVTAYTRAKMGGLIANTLSPEWLPPTARLANLEAQLQKLRPLAPMSFEAAFVENLQELTTELDPRDFLEDCRAAYTLDLFQTFFVGSISFLDQLYIPAICTSVGLPTYLHVFVDESQDLGGLEHTLLYKIVSRFPQGRIVAVGDPAQAIYAFKGAHYDSMEKLGKIFKAATLSLPVSFRCPKEVVLEAQRLNPQIQVWEHANTGQVIHKTTWDLQSLPRPSTILCRMNYPLIQTGLALIQAGIGAHFLSRNFEEELLTFFETWKKKSKILPGMFLALEQEIRKLESEDKHKANRLADYTSCLRAIAEQYSATTFPEVEAGIRILFNSPGPITLATIHKAKGLEWPHVSLIRPDLCPHPSAESDDDIQQEHNMLYVAVTRAQETFTYLYKQN